LAGINAGVFYLIIYFASMLAAMTMITYFTNDKGEALMVEDYRGLFWSRPWLAAFFTLTMLSLAGIPFTAGFMGKFFVLSSGMAANGGLFLLIVLVVSSTIGLFYYLRVVAAMLSRSETSSIEDHIGSHSVVLKLVIAALFILILWLGIYPSMFLEMLGKIG
ncbi:MAG TPA: proton-conducting transporter membrane subunit, partial [Agriterribacter sp.]|nr:proton-conducting transporter membrane subunit [Agriterribacter sp.]